MSANARINAPSCIAPLGGGSGSAMAAGIADAQRLSMCLETYIGVPRLLLRKTNFQTL
jgi:hypothetical protein